MSFAEFDTKNLDENQIGHLAWVLNSPSYQDIFKPYLILIRESMAQRLLSPDITRKDKYPDDFLRGGINVIDGLLALFTKLLVEVEAERIINAQQNLTDEQFYEQQRQAGNIRPASGLIPKDYSDEEDF